MNFVRRSTKLSLYEFAAGKWSDWANDADGIAYPTWGPDGRSIYYAGVNAPTYKRLKVGSRDIQQLLIVPNENPYATNVGPWSGLTLDGTMMYTRDVSSQNGYELDVEFP